MVFHLFSSKAVSGLRVKLEHSALNYENFYQVKSGRVSIKAKIILYAYKCIQTTKYNTNNLLLIQFLKNYKLAKNYTN